MTPPEPECYANGGRCVFIDCLHQIGGFWVKGMTCWKCGEAAFDLMSLQEHWHAMKVLRMPKAELMWVFGPLPEVGA